MKNTAVSHAPVCHSRENHRAQTEVRAFIVPPICHGSSKAGRDFMQILIFPTKGEKNLMGSLSGASTYRAQSVAGWRSFSVLFFFLFALFSVPYKRSPSPPAVSLALAVLFSRGLFPTLRADSWPGTFGP